MARIAQRTGLTTLSPRIQPGMNITGIMQPPSIAMTMLMAHPAPLTDCSVFPRTDINIIRPTKQNETHAAAIANME